MQHCESTEYIILLKHTIKHKCHNDINVEITLICFSLPAIHQGQHPTKFQHSKDLSTDENLKLCNLSLRNTPLWNILQCTYNFFVSIVTVLLIYHYHVHLSNCCSFSLHRRWLTLMHCTFWFKFARHLSRSMKATCPSSLQQLKLIYFSTYRLHGLCK
jgi:hypothetical protein